MHWLKVGLEKVMPSSWSSTHRVFSIIERNGYEVIKSRHGHILKVKENVSVPMLLIENKCDLENQRLVNKEEAEERLKHGKWII